MIFGIGTDIVEVERIAQKVQDREGFIKQVFSEREIEYCSKQANAAESYAARFAAKEAFLKALGQGLQATLELYKIEVTIQENGKPFLELTEDIQFLVSLALEQAPFTTHVSLSHTKTFATATVVLEIL